MTVCRWFLCACLIFSSALLPQERGDIKEDTKTTIDYFLHASYQQFTVKNNLYYSGVAIPTLWYSFEHDDRVTAYAMSREIKNSVDHVGDAGIIFNFPLVPIGLYLYGRRKQNTKLMQFSMEYAAAMYLALAESGLISYIPVHDRPSLNGISFWETAFRADSSFPSGHIIPYSTLFFKTLQFYGPYWSIIPLTMTVMSSMQRVQEGRHYFSDIIGSFFLSAFASEGVRARANYQGNHPFYKWIFENQAQVTFWKNQETWRVGLQFSY